CIDCLGLDGKLVALPNGPGDQAKRGKSDDQPSEPLPYGELQKRSNCRERVEFGQVEREYQADDDQADTASNEDAWIGPLPGLYREFVPAQGPASWTILPGIHVRLNCHARPPLPAAARVDLHAVAAFDRPRSRVRPS